MATENKIVKNLFNREDLIQAVVQYTYDSTRELMDWIDSPILTQTTLAQITGAVELAHSMVKEGATDAE